MTEEPVATENSSIPAENLEVKPGRGNPNIKNYRKTGPKTLEGAWKAAIVSGRMKDGVYSKLLRRIRKCRNCPLRPKEIRVRGQTITSQPRCPQYTLQEGFRCPVNVGEFIERSRVYYQMMELGDVNQTMQAVAIQMLAKGEVAEQMEMMEHGRPGYYSLEFGKAGAEILDRVQKNTQGEKHVNLNVDITQQWLREMFPLEDEDPKKEPKDVTPKKEDAKDGQG